MAEVALLLINTIVGMYLLIVILRFLLQLVKADFYNPISQFIVKATNLPLMPLRKIVPGWGGVDVASIILAMLIQVASIIALLAIMGYGFDPVSVVAWSAIGLFSLVLNIYKWGLFIVIIASWIAPNSYNPVLILLNQILEPVTRPVRKMMPDMGGLDLSPIAIFLGITIIHILIVKPLMVMTGLPSQVVFGI